MSKTEYFQYGDAEIAYLKSRDPVLGEAIDKIGKVSRAVIPDIFMALVNSIVGQQISTKAHATIWERMLARVSPLTAQKIAALSDEELQSCGISFRKAAYIKEIAAAVLDGSLDLVALEKQSDDEVCARLCALKGIGVWTAEMLLTFSMQRPDVISYGDLAILRGLRMLYHHRKITPALFAKYKRRYSPHATVASMYLWAVAGGDYGYTDYLPLTEVQKKAKRKRS